MPMPSRNIEGNYRYGYQGEFAEKEPELGNGQNSFELRLWDSRLGRWHSPDPYGQYPSPYLGMGNNPINGVDPDGGCFKDGEDCNPNAEVGTVVTGDAGLEWRMTNSGEYVLNNVDDAMQYTVVIGGDVRDLPFSYLMGIDSSPTMMFEDNGKTIGVEHDYLRKEQWRGLFAMTNASLGAGYSAAFPTVFTNARTQMPRQYAFSGGLAASAGTKTINYTLNANRVKMTVDVAEDNYVIMSGTVHGVKTQVGGFFSRNGNTITINGADFAGEIGITGIRNFAKEFANANGASNVIINTAKRTTGANPGKVQTFHFKF